MKDNRFIELVNLYVDRQISAEETAELEAEIQANPRRRAIYRQYCQLHTATKQVYAGFRSQGEPQAGAPAGRVIRGEFARRPRTHWVHYAGGLAAAACLAVVLVRYQNNAQPTETVIAETAAPTPAVQVAATVPVAPMPVSVAAAPGRVPVALKNNLAEPDYSAILTAHRLEEQRAFATGEIQPSRLPSLFDDGIFDSRPLLPANNQRVFRGKQAPAQAEFTAFQFQR